MDEVIQYDGFVTEHTEPKATMMEPYDAYVNRNAKDSVMFTLLDEQKAMKYWEEEIRQESEAKKCTENIRSLMKTLKLTAQQAMDALQIPPQEQEKYAKLL